MSISWWCRRERLFLLLMMALMMRLALWAQPPHQPANDETEYIAVAYDLLEGRGWQFYNHYHWLRAPLYPLFLAGSLWLSGGDLHLAALPNIVLSTATVVLVFFLSKTIVTPRSRGDIHHIDAHDVQHTMASVAPYVAALLTTLLFTLNTFASLYMSETLFTFLFTASLLLLLRWKQSSISTPARHGGPGWSGTGVMMLGGAGLLYGLATLTRSATVAFLPFVVLWMISVPQWIPLIQRLFLRVPRPAPDSNTKAQIWKTVASAILFLVCVLIPIAPWTIRNCQAYERCILIETGFSYNLWAFSEPHEDMGEIFRTLEQIPDPAARASEASQRGRARLQEDPMIIVRKLWPNWSTLWRIKPIQDRFLVPDYHGDPPPLAFLAALVLDDMLYVGILISSIVGCTIGVVRPEYRRSTLLLCAWIATIIGTSMLTHGEGRYRHFFFSLLIPYAAIGIISIVQTIRMIALRFFCASSPPPSQMTGKTIRTWFTRMIPLFLLILMCYPLFIYYPWSWAGGGAVRSLHRLVGDTAMALNQLDVARTSYERAYEAQKTQEGRLLIGDVFRRKGDLAEAEAHYRAGWLRKKIFVGANARLGEVLRAQKRDDEARKAFAGYFVVEQEMIRWSWEHLPIDAHPMLDVGDKLDFGLVYGVYDAETQQGATARWTNGYGQFRLATPDGAEEWSTRISPILTIRIAAPHPEQTTIPVQVCADEVCQQVNASPTWRKIQLLLPPPSRMGYREITLQSAVFEAPDGRRLGVLVDWLKLSARKNKFSDSVLQYREIMSTQPLPAVQAPHVLDFISHSQNQTIRIGQRIGEHVQSGDVLFLSGDLGSGKTHLVKGVAQGLGSTDLVTSPSFVLMNEYRAGAERQHIPIYHIDLYRIDDPGELRTIGLEEIWYDRGVVLVEWPERAMEQLPGEHLAIYLQHLDETKRILRFVPQGERYASLVEMFKHTAFG